MRLRLSALLVFSACGATSVAWGQAAMSSTQGPNLESMSYGLAGVNPRSGPGGAKLGDSTLLHLGIGAEAGYDSNVFYSTSDNRKGSGVARVTPAVNISNAERDGTLPDGVAYDLTASMGYREYLTSDEDIRKQRAFTPAAALGLQFSSNQTLSLSIMDSFTRSVDPPYVAGADPIRHDYNAAALQLRVAPGGGRLQLTLRGNSVLDYYEDDLYKNGSNIGNEGVLDISWRWLPKTAFFVQAAQGIINYTHSNSGRVDSYPLRLTGGMRGLLSEKLAINIGAGYVNTFYASGGANPSGFNNVILFAELIHKLSITQTAGLGYRHDVRNSPFVGNFYETHSIYAAVRQLVATRVNLSAYARFEYRNYHLRDATTASDVNLRTDKMLTAGVTADYIIARMVYLGVGYSVAYLNTDLPDTTLAQAPLLGIDYTKHVVVGRLGIIY